MAKAPAGSHTVLIVLENREFGEVIGAADAPYLNRLASRGALAVNDYAIAHPSLPNYLALSGGSTFGISEDAWRAYMGAMPSPCFRGAEAGAYAKRHNPFMYYPSVTDNPSLCARDVPETQLRAGTRLHRPYSHYSLLATIEDRFGVPRLRNARSATAIDPTATS